MMFLNLVHRPEAQYDAMFEKFKFQVAIARKHRLKATNLMCYNGLCHDGVVGIVKESWEKHGDEIGFHLHAYQGDAFRRKIPTRERFFWANTSENKRRIINLMMETCREKFGFLPQSFGSYYIDAPTLEWVKKTYPQVECVIATCFQEGVNMFHGTLFNCHLFNEGGPWWPWYPSKDHVLAPAKNRQDAIDVVALPHLVRDMVMSINDRNDVFASHPGNIIRGKAFDGAGTMYDTNFIDQYVAQDRYNKGYSYYNMFVSLPWLMFGYEDTERDVTGMYAKEIAHLAALKKKGQVTDMTMLEFARWFRKNRSYADMSTCYWQDILCGSGREAFWQIGRNYRACCDSSLGGAVCDLRPYVGRVRNKVGANQPNLWNGTYPYVIASHRRGSAMPRYGRASIYTAVISDGASSVNLSGTRALMKKFDQKTGSLALDPVKVELKSGTVEAQTSYRFSDDCIEMTTTLLRGPRDADLNVTHYVSASVGHTEYPEDIRGVKLTAEGKASKEHLTVAYSSTEKEIDRPVRLSAKIPAVNTELTLEPVGRADRGLIEDEFLFSPFFNLSLTGRTKPGGKFSSCLRLQKAR